MKSKWNELKTSQWMKVYPKPSERNDFYFYFNSKFRNKPFYIGWRVIFGLFWVKSEKKQSVPLSKTSHRDFHHYGKCHLKFVSELKKNEISKKIIFVELHSRELHKNVRSVSK
jgi:hypothetical protein